MIMSNRALLTCSVLACEQRDRAGVPRDHEHSARDSGGREVASTGRVRDLPH